MKKIHILSWVFLCSFSLTAWAQSPSWQALNYQAVALNEKGEAMKNQAVWLRISLYGKSKADQPVYIEEHQVNTNETGSFGVAIGRGTAQEGKWAEVPWAKELVWMRVELAPKENKTFSLISDKQLLAVPFALHARSSNNLVEPISSVEEKNQSIYWLTSGNSGTKPPVHFIGTTDNQNLVFRTNNIPHMTLTTQGKLELVSRVPAGPYKVRTSYPMVVEGRRNNQGMWIEINGTRSTANNFMTFVDDTGIQGRIEGETLDELLESERYVTQRAIYILSTISLGIELVAAGIEIPPKISSKTSLAEGIAITGKLVNLTAKLASLITAWTTWDTSIKKKVGVTYSSGNGDYAEWLLRKLEERDLLFAEVVGVKNGQVSLNTQNADHILVVSKAPIILGNAPQPNEENLYEKIAFMGQVPVRVAGPVALNDYIIPSGNNDGFAIAVHPQDMKTLDYGKIIGIAWEAAEDQPINIINMAIGINTNDLAPKVEALMQKVQQIENYLALSGATTMQATQSKFKLDSILTKTHKTVAPKLFNDAEFDQYLDENAAQLNAFYSQLNAELNNRQIDFSSNPALQELFNNPIAEIKKFRRNPAYLTQWGLIDQKIKSKK